MRSPVENQGLKGNTLQLYSNLKGVVFFVFKIPPENEYISNVTTVWENCETGGLFLQGII